MNGAIKNLLAILASLAITVVLIWIFVRGRALSKPIPEPLVQPFLTALSELSAEQRVAIIAHRGGWAEKPENTLIAFEAAAALGPDVILWADVRPTADSTLVVFRDRELSTTTDGKGWIGFTKDADVFSLDPAYKFLNAQGQPEFRGKGLKILRLEELLAHFPDRRFILNFRDYRDGLQEKIFSAIDGAKAGDRVLIASPEDGILRDLREKRPMWVFGTSQAQATRLKMLASIGLEAAVPLKGDVFVFDPEGGRTSLYNLPDSVIAEVHRRKMKVIAGPALDLSSAAKMKASGVDGILAARPSEVAGKL